MREKRKLTYRQTAGKQHHRVTYTRLLTDGRLNVCLTGMERQAQERFERFLTGMKQAPGIIKPLKRCYFTVANPAVLLYTVTVLNLS